METAHRCHDESLGEKSSSSLCDVQGGGLTNGESSKVDTPIQSGLGTDLPAQGKPKKTPFKLFCGRKSLVSLPSFFGGKNKGSGKANAKKSLSKSKTHDCISEVTVDVDKKGYFDNSLSRHNGHDIPKTGTLPSSLSADSGITSPVKLDFNFQDISPMGSTEGFDKKIGGEKSFSFPRPKKGLKGFFSSIRRHKKSKADHDKCERYDHITETVILEQLNRYHSEDADLQRIDEQPKKNEAESEVSPDSLVDVSAVGEEEATQPNSVSMSNLTIDQIEEVVAETSEELSDDQNPCGESKSDSAGDPPDPEVFPVVVKTESLDKVSTSHSTSEQLNLMFEDVSSLKSFDSFTGCGDIIAEQDIDNISDTSMSLERSREATKRSSCLVTYQGGGEEMATPDDMEEEYLQQLLEDGNENEAPYGNENEAAYECEEEKAHDEMSKGFSKLESCTYSAGTEDAFVDRTALNSAEMLSPQSDHQESAPNSDEGYYDSNTPGPDEDAGEAFSHKERLPRDSYSGDALYEFYEPDDSLMSPAPGGESLYENKSLCSEIFDQFFDFSLPLHHVLNESQKCKEGATETEEERLAVIQKQLLFWERQREVSLKGLGQLNKDVFSKEKQIECEIRTARSKGCLKKEQGLGQDVSKDVDSKEFPHAENVKQSRKDFQEGPLLASPFHISYNQPVDGAGDGLIEDPGFELNVDISEAQSQIDATLSAMTNANVPPMHHAQNVFASDFSSYNPENECEQAVNFSQTLADFSDNGMLFSSISERLGSAGSGSSFHHNFNALPTMVTFDVVDFENEGECDQQIDLSPDEEAVSPFETFDHSYVQESLAECDEPFLQMGSNLPFHNNYNWGVTSLPRHLDQYKLNPLDPAPLSLDRRSKSLDAELLELELGGLQLSKSGLKSYDLLTPWENTKNPWQCEDGGLVAGKADSNSCNRLGQIVLTDEKLKTTKQVFRKEPEDSNLSSQLPACCKPTTENVKYNTRPSHQENTTKNVQYNSRPSQEENTTKNVQYNTRPLHEENTTKKLARVLPLEERKPEAHHSCGYNASKKPLKPKPIGITQAMPQHCKKDIDPPSNYMDSPGPAKKGLSEHRGISSAEWGINYSECSNG